MNVVISRQQAIKRLKAYALTVPDLELGAILWLAQRLIQGYPGEIITVSFPKEYHEYADHPPSIFDQGIGQSPTK